MLDLSLIINLGPYNIAIRSLCKWDGDEKCAVVFKDALTFF